MIASDLIAGALRLVGIATPGQALSADDTQIGLDALNQLLEDWSLQNLAVLNLVDATYSLAAGTATYTIGTGGTFNGQRPIEIATMYVRYNSIDYPIVGITNEDYNNLAYKAQSGPIPFVFNYTPTFPLGTLTFWPVPNQILQITVTANQQLTQIPLSTTTLSLAPGYARALKYNLAVDLCAEYDRDTPPNVEKVAIRSLANIKRANMVAQTIGIDPMFMQGNNGQAGSYYANFIAGNY